MLMCLLFGRIWCELDTHLYMPLCISSPLQCSWLCEAPMRRGYVMHSLFTMDLICHTHAHSNLGRYVHQ